MSASCDGGGACLGVFAASVTAASARCPADNAVPPLLFFGYVFLKPGSPAFHNACFYLHLASVTASLGAVVCLWFVAPVVYGN